MVVEFNLSGLKNLYISALHSFDKSMAFDMQIGRGRFLFMMYLSEEDKEARDKLFVYMRNTRVLREIKMYGNHLKGDFRVYFNQALKTQFIHELQLIANNGDFDFHTFLTELNSSIPLEISQTEKIRTIRMNREVFNRTNYASEPEKTVLIGDKHLSVGTPQDKTLRKLFLYTDSTNAEIESLITLLKRTNRTLSWTTEDKNYKAADIRQIISSLQNIKKP